MQERKPGCICELSTETGEPLVANYAECLVHKSESVDTKQEANSFIYKFYQLRPLELMTDDQRSVAWGIAKKSAEISMSKMIELLEKYGDRSYTNTIIPYYKNIYSEIQKL